MTAINGRHGPAGDTARMPPARLALLALNIALLLLLLLIAGYKLGPAWFPPPPVSVPGNPDCNLQAESCRATLPDGRILTLDVSPRPMTAARPMSMRVSLDGPSPRAIDADIAGIGMAMGLNRVPLRPRAAGLFTGETSLAVCLTGAMRWQLTLLIDTGNAIVGVPFHFSIPGQ